jgi:hypothetical protein
MRRVLVLLVLLLCSCASTSPMLSATPPPTIEPEEEVTPMPTETVPPDIEPEEEVTPMPTETVPPDIEPEEYAVYSALIRQNPTGYDLGSFVVIREQTVLGVDDMFEQSLEENPDLPTGLADSYRSRNAAPYTLGPELDVELDYVLMPQDEFERIFGHVRPVAEDWSDFDAAYPGASGLLIFSRVGFNATGDRALALMGYRCHGLCGAGGLYLLVKEDGDWKVQGSLYEWMS